LVAGHDEEADWPIAQRVSARFLDVAQAGYGLTNTWLDAWRAASDQGLVNEIAHGQLIDFVVLTVGELLKSVADAITAAGGELPAGYGQARASLDWAEDLKKTSQSFTARLTVDEIDKLTELIGRGSEDANARPDKGKEKVADPESDLVNDDSVNVPSQGGEYGSDSSGRSRSRQFDAIDRETATLIDKLQDELTTETRELLRQFSEAWQSARSLASSHDCLKPLASINPQKMKDAIGEAGGILGTTLRSIDNQLDLSVAVRAVSVYIQVVDKNVSQWLDELRTTLKNLSERLLWRPGSEAAQKLLDCADGLVSRLVSLRETASKFVAPRADEVMVGIDGIHNPPIAFSGAALLDGLTRIADVRLEGVRQANRDLQKAAKNDAFVDLFYRIDGPDKALVLLGNRYRPDLRNSCHKVSAGCQVIKGRNLNLGSRVNAWGRAVRKGQRPSFNGELLLVGVPDTARAAVAAELRLSTGKEVRFDSSPAVVADPLGRFGEPHQSREDDAPSPDGSGTYWDNPPKTVLAFLEDAASDGAPGEEFRSYLVRGPQTFEQFDFLRDVKRFRAASCNEQRSLANDIYRNYFWSIKVGVPLLNVDHETVSSIESELQNGATSKLFDSAERVVAKDLNVHYSRFLTAPKKR
jgi:hypothetical protein